MIGGGASSLLKYSVNNSVGPTFQLVISQALEPIDRLDSRSHMLNRFINMLLDFLIAR